MENKENKKSKSEFFSNVWNKASDVGKKAAEGISDFAEKVFPQHRSHFLHLLSKISFLIYHSISSTGVGLGFSVISATVPFLMRITRSAMGVRALLWVMTMTVTPPLRQLSCKSFKTALPVT